MPQETAQAVATDTEIDRLKSKCNEQLNYITELKKELEAAEAAATATLVAIPDQGNRLLTYTTEYLAIAAYLSKKQPIKNDKNSISVDKTELYKLLMKNAYELPENKLRVWRGLGWIETDPGRLTRRIRVDGRIVQVIKIRVPVFLTLQGITSV